MSSDEFEIKNHSKKKGIREFCIDSNKSSSFVRFGERKNKLEGSKHFESDIISIKTSKGNNKDSQKYSQLPSQVEERFHFNFFNQKKTDQTAGINIHSSKEEIFSRNQSFDSQNILEEADYSNSKKERQKQNKPEKMSIKRVKNFVDFQRILRDLKLTLNTGIYAQFDDNIEEKIQKLNLLLNKYKENDLKIEELYDRMTTKKEQCFETLIYSTNDSSNSHSIKNKESFNNLFNKVQNLKNSSNFETYESKIIKIQNNPSDFESFLFSIKGEVEKRESIFVELKTKVDQLN